MKLILPALRIFFVLTLLTGVIYPLLMTGLGQLIFPLKANGSILSRDGKEIGSKLIAQKFTADKYFWERPSAVDYNPLASGGSNLGPTSEALRKLTHDREEALRRGMNGAASVPQDLIFASGSGLDPELSPEGVRFQTERVAKARGLNPEQTAQLEKLIDQSILAPELGFIGEPRVNVLELNLALDTMVSVR